MIDIKDVKVGDTVTLEHPDGSRLVNREVDSVYSVQTGERRSYVRGLVETGWSITDHKPAIVLPTEPGIYLAASGLSWELRAEDQNYCRRWFLGGTYMTDTNARLAAPFTRLIPEGSEREQAVRDVIGEAYRRANITLGQADDLHLAMGVTP